jgi:hypothetical protein
VNNMGILSVDNIKKLNDACMKLSDEENVRHVGVCLVKFRADI